MCIWSHSGYGKGNPGRPRINRIIRASLYIVLLFPIFTHAEKPSITNIRHERDGNFFIITYDLNGPNRPIKRKIKVVISSMAAEGGTGFVIKPKAIYGAVGRGITPGDNKTIVWIVPKDYPERWPISSSRVKVKVTLKSSIGRAAAVLTVAGGGAAAYYYYVYLPSLPSFPLPPDRPE